MSRRIHGSLILGLFALLAAAAPARADTIAVGAVWFQTDYLGTYDFIEILNLSGDPSDGGYAEPPAYPVYTPLSFENATITYVTEDGTENTVLLGTISPGAWIPDDLYFDPSVEFASIAFSAAIYPATFLVGSQPYQATDITASSLLQNGDGSPLLPFLAYADIDVQADPTGSIPEPRSALLAASALLAGLGARRRKRS